jgi:hypothetical protein
MKLVQPNSEKWYEFRTWASESFINLLRAGETKKACRILYKFKREVFLPVIKEYGLKCPFILDEFLDRDRFILLRVKVSEDISNQIKQDLEKRIQDGQFKRFFINVELKYWPSKEDAKNRILDARKRAEQIGISFKGIPEDAWKITGMKGYNIGAIPLKGTSSILIPTIAALPEWEASPDELDKKTEIFEQFMTKVAGEFTKIFLEEIPEYIDDRWLMSLFIHLLLNSLSIWYEDEARAFPYI